MRGKELLDKMEHIAPELIEGATDTAGLEAAGKESKDSRPGTKGKGKAAGWIKWVAVAACVCVIAGAGAILRFVVFNGGEKTADRKENVFAIELATYPEMAVYPHELDYVKPNGEFDEKLYDDIDMWHDDVNAQREMGAAYTGGLNDYFKQSVSTFLSNSEGVNRIVSPTNIYMALGMLAEITEGQSRGQILNLLGADSVEQVRSDAYAIWNGNYRDDGSTKSVMASSIWMNEQIDFNKETLKNLSENYFSSSYKGKMGSEEFNKALQSWLNNETGGLLEEQAGMVEMTPDTIIALATTIYLKAKWNDEFLAENNTQGIFHAAAGDEECEFMNQRSSGRYWFGENFSAISRYMLNDGSMFFILPDEDVSVDELLQDKEMLDFLVSEKYEWPKCKELMINQTIPKFDAASDIDIADGLKSFGITDVFDSGAADFSPLTDDVNAFLTDATHAARVRIDEQGCEAAAFTVMMAGAGMPPEEEVDFKVDRPFIFMITGPMGLPLFVGVVNQP
ncbi:MAG: serpin family protein [Lachnospiraceae bacterium]|jgi:serine protease inhibitor